MDHNSILNQGVFFATDFVISGSVGKDELQCVSMKMPLNIVSLKLQIDRKNLLTPLIRDLSKNVF